MSVINPLYIVSGFLVGFLIGQTGVGGGSLMTPLLVLLFGVSPATAVGTDLFYATTTKSIGTLVHGYNHTVDWRVVRRLASGSIPATIVTLLVIARTGLGGHGGGAITFILGVMLLLTAASVIFRRQLLSVVRPSLDRMTTRQTAATTVVVGAALGSLVTLSSVGAGALGVTALMMLYPGLPLRVIVGSDIAHAVPLTFVAGVGHWWLGSLDWPLLASLLCGSIPGIILGSYAVARVPEPITRFVLAGVLIIAGARLVF